MKTQAIGTLVRIGCAWMLGVLCVTSALQAGGPLAFVTPQTTQLGERDFRSLDGSWAFMPGDANADEPNVADNTWGTIAVPGSWKSNGWPGVELGLQEGGLGPAWNNYAGGNKETLTRGWYRRTIVVPADWDGRRVLLGFERLSTDATAFIDGDFAGDVAWPSGELDITNLVKPGVEQELLVRVDLDISGADHVQDMILDAYDETEEFAQAAGLVGSVSIRSDPRGPHVDYVFVKTSVSNKQLSIELEMSGVGQPEDVAVVARLLDHAGDVERTFEGTAKADPDLMQTVTVAFEWSDPRLWDLDQPELYVLDLTIHGKGWQDRVQQRFGFREVSIDGRDILLNGTPIRLRPMETSATLSAEDAEAILKLTRKSGFNQLTPWPQKSSRGMLGYAADVNRIAAELGMLTTAVLPDMRDFIGLKGERWSRPGFEEEYERLARAELRRLRNFASVVTWVTTPNFLGHSQDQNPLTIGRHEGGPSRQSWEQREPPAREGVALLKRLDDTRPVMLHNGSDVGDIYSVNFYLNWTPIEERARWFTHFNEHGDMPLSTIETGLPLFTSLLRGRAGYLDATKTEPLVTEFLAEYLGDEAYERETDELRHLTVDYFRGGDTYKSLHNNRVILAHQPYRDVQLRHVFESKPFWRLGGPTAGAIPWNLRMAELGYEWRDIDFAWEHVNHDTLAFIAGRPDDPYEQQERFTLGQAFVKQAAVVNDTRKPQTYSGSWTATVGDELVGRGEISGTVDVAEHAFETIRFDLPTNLPSSDKLHTSGVLALSVEIAGRTYEDTLDFRVFAPVEPAVDSVKTALFDPTGKTAEAMSSVGVAFEDWTPWSKSDVLVVGREALSTASADEVAAIERYAQDGGLVVVMAQQPEFYKDKLGLRVGEQISRQVFPLPHGHKLTDGLDARDLHRFNGVSTLLSKHRDFAYDWREQSFLNGAVYPAWGWRWGGHHGVSSVPLEIPHRSAATPLLVGGFDLMYSPVLVMPMGDGKLVLNTLDVEDHAAIDPVAGRLLQRLVDPQTYADVTTPSRRTIFVGQGESRALLQHIGLTHDFDPSVDIEDLVGDAEQTLLVLDGSRGETEAVSRFVEAGGHVLVLPLRESASGIEISNGTFDEAAPAVPNWPATHGLTVASLRSRAALQMPLIQGGVDEIAAGGLLGQTRLGDGVLISVQADATSLPTRRLTYLRFTAWNQTRLLSQVAANLGGRFEFDNSLHLYGVDPELLPLDLSGEWQAVLTQPMPAAKTMRDRLNDPGQSTTATSLIASFFVGESIEATTTATVPDEWETNGPEWETADGEAVFFKTVTLPQAWHGQTLTLTLGRVDDIDATFVNGELVGRGDGWDKDRIYQIPGRLHADGGELRIAVRVFDNFGGGGLTGGDLSPNVQPRTLGARPMPYHPDYREQHSISDHPDRYYRW
ncbi:MAG: sugar-binding domain-containing protein [Planctomycetota bacterium]